jgi:hypothetical protein
MDANEKTPMSLVPSATALPNAAAITEMGIPLPDFEKLSPYVKKALVLFPALRSGNDGKAWIPQVSLALLTCMEKKLNPFTQQCHLVPYAHKDGSVTISVQIAVEELVRRANSDPKVHHIGNGDIMVQTANGEIKRMNGCIVAANAQIIGAVCTVHFADGSTEDYSVSMKMYMNQARHWSDAGFMLTKCARAHACRCVAPDVCGGIYTAGELPGGTTAKATKSWEEQHPEEQPATVAPAEDKPILDLGVVEDGPEDATFHEVVDPNELGPPIEGDWQLNPDGGNTPYEPADDDGTLDFHSRANDTSVKAAPKTKAKATTSPFEGVKGTLETCAQCGGAVSAKSAKWCEDHAGDFDGKYVCFDCQHPEKVKQ